MKVSDKRLVAWCFHRLLVNRLVMATLALACLSACAPPEPPGKDLWKLVACVEKGLC